MDHKQSARNRHKHDTVCLSLSYPIHDFDSPQAIFRSPRVLKQVAEAEKKHKVKKPMTPEEAFEKLQRLMLTMSSNKCTNEILGGLKHACWQSFASKSDDCNQQSQVLYSQLFRCTQEMVLDEAAACQNLRNQIQQLTQRNNTLPERIKERQVALIREMESTVLGTKSLEPRDISTDKVDASSSAICHDKVSMRQRIELRTWACNNLRATIDDLELRHNDIKRQVHDASLELKKEEQVNHVKMKRLEDLRKVPITSSLSSLSRVGSRKCTQQQLARFTLALARNQLLQDTLKERQAFVQARTVAIFDVRNLLHDLNDQKMKVNIEFEGLQDQVAHIKRVCTPRPDWRELRDATSVTTAVDEVDLLAQMRSGALREEDRDNEQRVLRVLSSNWSTVTKASALAAELATIRSRDHAPDTISSEETKLKVLQSEIVRLRQQLEAIKGQSDKNCTKD
ncbi:uncharacterized protein PHALS_01282 [Plasmopara halstedii]|uniref:Uncharacterized protein n=1 Tax=Plasmopara halstedii TaxID=4781 RepID=A0A0P1ASR9_PLAHL|nr:uncharacterized protein PHALS_01282 [Plasmopara halstedii]CEG44959.1 hypothetical protein PHALS_01282 [Plasmopara halstedii]|eukprot:XP_024581328.1 hypothetical protein PHALS_01282 [Plasmopara halstedii]